MNSRTFCCGLALLTAFVLCGFFTSACTTSDETPIIETLAPATLQIIDTAPPPTPSPTPLEIINQSGPKSSKNDLAPAEPPVIGQGGTCISGFIIDRYHQASGANWRVTATAQDGTTQVQSADASGRFHIGGLSGGTWTVALEVPSGWRPFTPASFPVTLSGSGSNCANVRFKVETLACLEVTKLDAHGALGGQSLVGIPGWEIEATLGSTALTELTDWEGKARFYNLAPGTWTVEEESKVGWIPGSGHSSKKTINLVSPHSPGACASLTFVNQQQHTRCVQVRKVDQNGNPLRNWKFTLIRDDGTWPPSVQYTDAAGYVVFDGLALGEWTVQEEVKAWWRPIGPTEQKVNLTEPGNCVPLTFQNEALGCIDGYKINQLNQGLGGWTIKARNEDTGDEFTAVSDEHGYFKFPPLRRGTWKVSEVMQTGWEPVTPNEIEVTVDQAHQCETIRFKNKTSFACVDVYKRDHVDGAGLPGWDITLQPAYGGSPVTGTTDGTGHVRFNGLTPGIYNISEKAQSGWTAVTPQSQQVMLEASGTCRIITFKNRQGADPPPSGTCHTRYRVCPGDTLYTIARRYGTTVTAIKRANSLWSNKIYAGQRLCIP